ncbi:MAG: tetratricopeptide repeat protein, partial [Sphingomonas sp.]
MNRIRFYRPALFALAVASIGGAPAFAQTDPTAVTATPIAPAIPSNPDADLLASEMRFLAQNPRDLRALLSAASISTRLGDTSAALAFYARAEKIDPENPRIMAGRAQVLVRLERPGEALRLFQAAEARGLPMGEYLSDRGLAYDLLGQPLLAQRDYKAALSRDRDDETVRRYALSLGITGKYDDAMRELDPLLRRSDRAAWRARAFILAMQGDFDGAERIAASMMPGNMGAALGPFFRRLPGLSPGDKAFAVHFGALTPTQARRADAQLAPQMAPYVPERIIQPPPQVAVAAVAPTPAPAPPPARGKRQSRRDREPPTQLAAVTSVAARPVPPPPAANPLPPPPQYQPPTVQPIPIATPTPSAPVQVAAVTPAPSPALPTMRRVPGVRPTTSRLTGSSEGDVPIAAGGSRPAPVPPGRARPGEGDGVLANIVGGITIPPEELAKLEVPEGDAPAPATTRDAPPAPATTRAAPPKPEARPAAKPAATPAR